MELVNWLAIKFEEEGVKLADWPEGVVATQDNCEVRFEGWKTGEVYTYSSGKVHEYDLGWSCEGDFKYLEEYDEGQSCSREEFEDFLLEHPMYVQDIKAKREIAVKRIAELNEIAYEAVKEAIELSRGAALPYTCRMPMGVADLDENSDWDSSRC